MPENDRLSGCLDGINLEFVEREAARSQQTINDRGFQQGPLSRTPRDSLRSSIEIDFGLRLVEQRLNPSGELDWLTPRRTTPESVRRARLAYASSNNA